MTVTQILVVLFVMAVVAVIWLWPHEEETPLTTEAHPAVTEFRHIPKSGDLLSLKNPQDAWDLAAKVHAVVPPGKYLITLIHYTYEIPQSLEFFIIQCGGRPYRINSNAVYQIEATYPSPRPAHPA